MTREADPLDAYRHAHTFGQDRRSAGERRTLIVTLLTALFMIVEVVAGVAYGSMALLADGLHMGSHALALGIAVAAYVFARRRAADPRFSFGTGKVNALGGFTGALLLAGFAAAMAWESVARLLEPVEIVFDQAIFVAVVGLVVNGVSVALLGVHSHEHGGHAHDHGGHAHGAGRDHDHDDPQRSVHHEHGAHEHGAHEHESHEQESHEQESHGHESHGHGAHEHEHGAHEHESHGHGAHEHESHGSDHNLRSAYLHVLADALTSFCAIFALLGGKLLGLNWLDPVMGIVGSLLVANWSWGLLRQTSRVLLDCQAPPSVLERLTAALEASGEDRVTDLHVWSIGPGVWASEITLVTSDPRPPSDYKARLPGDLGLEHVSLEVHALDSGAVT